ncbi:MAG: hypothetical protein CMJ42_18500 [Phyllobacteriaceae bacterium]|nr:hypothetical protein [Phyllobacteriaceae bacterium]MBA90191.1 hypothetical protein [Phyllobacteriaceae bacterium]
MEHLAALMLIIACGNTPESCDVHPSPVTGYESMQACRQAIGPVLGSADRRDGLLVARCLEVDPADEREMEIVWDVTEDGGLHASVQAVEEAPSMIAQAGGTGDGRTLR